MRLIQAETGHKEDNMTHEDKEKTVVGEVTTVFPVTRYFVDCVLSAAFEGGITYWASAVHVPDFMDCDYASEVVGAGGQVVVVDGETEDHHELNLEKFLKGLKLAIGNPNVDLENMDSTAADIVVQCALFGEIVYG